MPFFHSMSNAEGYALQFVGRTFRDRFAKVAGFCPEQSIVEHGRSRDIVPPSEADGDRGGDFSVGIGVFLEIAAYYLIESVPAYQVVYMVFEIVPCSVSGIECRRELGSNVRIVEYLSVGG